MVDVAPLETLLRSSLEATVAARIDDSHCTFFAAAAARLSGVRATPEGVQQRHQGVQCELPYTTCLCNDDLDDRHRANDDDAEEENVGRSRSDTQMSVSGDALTVTGVDEPPAAMEVFAEVQPLMEDSLKAVLTALSSPPRPSLQPLLAEELLAMAGTKVKPPPPSAEGLPSDAAVLCHLPWASQATGGRRRLKFRGDGSYRGEPRTDVDVGVIAAMVGRVSNDVALLDLSENASITCAGLERLRTPPVGLFPQGLFLFPRLVELRLVGCRSLAALPSWIASLAELREMVLIGCAKLGALPETMGDLGALQVLDLSRCSALAALPPSMSRLRSLAVLTLSECHGLGTPRTTLPDLSAAKRLRVVGAPHLLQAWTNAGLKELRL